MKYPSAQGHSKLPTWLVHTWEHLPYSRHSSMSSQRRPSSFNLYPSGQVHIPSDPSGIIWQVFPGLGALAILQ